MNKKQKSSIILASLATIAVSGSLIAGATYALFTSESKTNIAVTSGKVDVTATISDLVTYSGEENSLTGNPATDADNIKSYEELGIDNGKFLNGGTAVYDEINGTLKLDKMTPGDKVTFSMDVVNKSNVAIKYRTKVAKVNVSDTEESDEYLFNALKFTIGDFTNEITTAWTTLASGNEGVNLATYECSIELPSDVSREDYMGKSCAIDLTVEAIQANAQTSDEGATHLIHSEDEFKGCIRTINEGGNILLANDITLNYAGNNAAGTPDTYLCTGNVVIDLNGHTITTNIPNGESIYAFSIAANNVTLKNGKIAAGVNSSGKTISYPLQITAKSQNAKLENLEITGGVYVCGYSAVTITDCKITATNYYDIYSVYNTKVTIESGEFIRTVTMPHFCMGEGNETIILNGGTFEDNICYYSGNGTITNNVSTITVTKK